MDNPSGSRSEWTLTEEAFARFLERLDPDKESAGEKYEALRLTLVKFFDWRGAHFPEECVDETFNRVARKVDSGEVISDIATYCHGVARMILLETLRHPSSRKARAREARALHDLAQVSYSLGKFDEARIQIEQALEIEESLRVNVINQD